MSWPLLIYDFPPSFADKLTPVVNRYLKKWLNLSHPVSPEIFYLPETGLKLKHPKTTLKGLQLTKHHLLTYSRDPKVRYIYESRLLKASKSRANRWHPEVELQKITDALEWESKYSSAGNLRSSSASPINFITAPNKDKRKLISQRLK